MGWVVVRTICGQPPTSIRGTRVVVGYRHAPANGGRLDPNPSGTRASPCPLRSGAAYASFTRLLGVGLTRSLAYKTAASGSLPGMPGRGNGMKGRPPGSEIRTPTCSRSGRPRRGRDPCPVGTAAGAIITEEVMKL